MLTWEEFYPKAQKEDRDALWSKITKWVDFNKTIHIWI